MTSPSPEEVAKAQEWLRDCPGDWAIGELADVYAQPVAELLASYAAEQGRDSAAAYWKQKFIESDNHATAAESRLTSLREGLRRLVTAARAIEVADDGSHGAAIGIHAVQSALCEAESLLAGLAEKKES